MIHIVADTTVYRADPKREKAAFRTLCRLAAAGYLTLHIPEIVLREFVSQQQGQYSDHVDALRAGLRDMGKRALPDPAADLLRAMADQVTALDASVASFAKDDFAKWVAEVSGVIHPIEDSHGARVVDAYFSGAPPFRGPKRRDDFPDAFLWQTICDLAKVYDPLYVVSADKGILTAVSGIGMAGFESLEGFVASPPVQAVLGAHFASVNVKALLALLPRERTHISAVIENDLVDELAWQTVHSDQIPDDNSEAKISAVGSADDLDLDVAAAVDHGEGSFVVPFSLRSECLLDYAIFKSDLYLLEEEKADKISTTELNDHYYSAEEYYVLRVEGALSFEVDAEALKASDLSEDDLRGILYDATITVDSIARIEVE